MDKLITIKNQASLVANAKEAASGAKSLANTLLGQAVYVFLQGTLQERVALKRWVSKDGEGNKFKQYVSKAQRIADAASEGVTFNLKDSQVEASVIINGSFENIPEVTFTALYNAVNEGNKGSKAAKERAALALELGAAAQQPPLSEADVKELSAADKAMVMQMGDAILSNMEAQEQKKVSAETFADIQNAIASMTAGEREAIVTFIAQLESEAKAA